MCVCVCVCVFNLPWIKTRDLKYSMCKRPFYRNGRV